MGGQRVTYSETQVRIDKLNQEYPGLNAEIYEFKGSRTIVNHNCLDCNEIKISCIKNLQNGIGLYCKNCGYKHNSQARTIAPDIITQRIKSTDSEIIISYGRTSNPILKEQLGSESIVEHDCLGCGKRKLSNFGNYIKMSGLFCKECGLKNTAQHLTKDMKYLLDSLKEKYSDIVFTQIDEYNGRHTKLAFLCQRCSKDTVKTFNGLIEGYPLCKKCSKKQTGEKLALLQDDVQEYIERYEDKLVSGLYKNNRSKLTIECICGNHYICSFAEFQDGQTRCSACSKAKTIGEGLIEEVLLFYCNEFDYDYDTQVSFDNCKSSTKTMFRFDYVLYSDKAHTIIHRIYEHNGIQHYEFTPFYHRTYNDFKKQMLYDKDKIKYCADKKYPLVITRYDQLASCQDIIMDDLKFTPDLREKFYYRLPKIRNLLWNNNIILVYNLHGDFIGNSRTITDCSLFLQQNGIHISQTEISACLSNKRKQSSGLIFIYKKDIGKLSNLIKELKEKRPSYYYLVRLTSKSTPNEFYLKTTKDAKDFLNLPRTSMITQACGQNLVCNTPKYSTKKYICQWYDPITQQIVRLN